LSRATFQPEEGNAPSPLTVDEAQALVLRNVGELATESVPLGEARTRVIRESILASRDIPELDNSAMDGYAVRLVDVEHATAASPSTLPVAFDIPAGVPVREELPPGAAARIMTGAPVPRGTEAVVPVESTDGGIDLVTFFRSARPGENIRRRGEDMLAGSEVIGAGTVIGSGEIVVLATLQKSRVMVSRKPIVAILPTGDELIEIDAPFESGKIINSNAWSIAALVEEYGGTPRVHSIVGDSLESTVRAVERLNDADMIISTGGVSVGAFDFVKKAMDALGAQRIFWRVKMKPGKPVLFAKLDDRPFFGLPGNPVSSMVSFHLFVAPALRRMLGRESTLPLEVNATLDGTIGGAGDRDTFHRVCVRVSEGELRALPMRRQGSGVSSSMLGANGLARCRAGESFPEGTRTSVLLIGELQRPK